MPADADKQMSSFAPVGYTALGTAKTVVHDASSVRLTTTGEIVEVTALAPDLFRVGLFAHGHSVTYSSAAVVAREWESGSVTVSEGDGFISIATAAASARIALDPLRIGFADATGRTFAVDDPELGMGWLHGAEQAALVDIPNPLGTLGTPLRVYKQHAAGERYFGCGERTAGLDKTGSHQIFWNVDPPRGHTALQNNLYVSIPFTLALVDGKAWGFFLDSPAFSEFDLADEDAQRSWFGTAGGDLIYYIFCGPTPSDVLARYTELTGHTPLPPMWSLGNGQSRYGYETADEVLRVAHGFREHDIPCDTLYLDIDYMDGYRDFTWDRTRFPDPEGLLAELRALGFHVVSIIDAGVKVDEHYPVYTEGRDRNLYCKTLDGSDYQNAVWPGLCVFPDFINPETRSWWGEQHQPLLDAGVAGIWCDMNEPALFIPLNSTMPPSVVHSDAGQVKFHLQVHNAYGSLMSQATREGLLRLRPEQRPFVISRAGYAGIQRYALLWTGDNSATWEHLAMSIVQLQNLGLSGIGWSGVDIGGFYGDTNGELLARWIEWGIFQPFCRNHAEKLTRHQEPWVFGEPYTSLCRSMLKFRQRLIPYLYTLFEECHRTGQPLLRPLFWEHPEDTAAYTVDDEVLCGNALLIAPITKPGIEYRYVYLPAGTWFHFWTNERVDGPAHILAHAPLGQPALYMRANNALPLGASMSYVGEVATDDLTLILYPAEGSGTSALYEDAGDGYEQVQGVYARRTITCDVEAKRIRVTLSAQEGTFNPTRKRVQFELREVSSAPVSVSCGESQLDWHYNVEQKTIIIELDESSLAQTLDIFLS
jgi:alpha-glucosidase